MRAIQSRRFCPCCWGKMSGFTTASASRLDAKLDIQEALDEYYWENPRTRLGQPEVENP